MKAPTSLLFIVSAGPEFGLGHLRRMQAVARAYRKTGGQGPVEFYLLGCSTSDLAALDHDTADGHLTAGSSYGMAAFCLGRPHDVLMVDVHKNHIEPQLFRLSQQLQLSGARLVAIDHVAIQDEMQADVRWVPSFFKDPAWPDHLDIQYGWDHYLIEKRLERAPCRTRTACWYSLADRMPQVWVPSGRECWKRVSVNRSKSIGYRARFPKAPLFPS
jgi:hypothetical protein